MTTFLKPLFSLDGPPQGTGRDDLRGVRRQTHALVFGSFGTVLVVLLAGGCGDGRFEVSPVRGRVVYKGQGVPMAVVIFHPSEDAPEQARKMRPFAYGDVDGNFELKTYVDGDGAPPGEYRVSIIARSVGPSRGPRKDAPVAEQAAVAAPIRIPPAVSQKYSNVDTSGIKVTVQEGENNLEPFVL